MVDTMTAEGREDEIDPNWLIMLDGLHDDSLWGGVVYAVPVVRCKPNCFEEACIEGES